jgi:hypothetical protein
MAILTVRTTYALDVPTVRALDRIARRWKVSKSEALRRVIRSADQKAAADHSEGLEALNQLQKSLGLTAAEARAWATRVRRERRTASARSENRGG